MYIFNFLKLTITGKTGLKKIYFFKNIKSGSHVSIYSNWEGVFTSISEVYSWDSVSGI